MTDPIPQVYLDEAVRRSIKAGYKYSNDAQTYVQLLARTLQELGWKPPVPPELKRAREIAAQALDVEGWSTLGALAREGQVDDNTAVQAALIALREGMGE